MLHLDWQYCRVAIFSWLSTCCLLLTVWFCKWSNRRHFAFSPLEVGIFGCRKVLVCSNIYYCVEHTTAAGSVFSLYLVHCILAFAPHLVRGVGLCHESYYVYLLKENPNIWWECVQVNCEYLGMPFHLIKNNKYWILSCWTPYHSVKTLW